MSTNTTVNGQTVVHKDSGGVVNTSPDVCVTPIGNSIVPIPYVNVAKSADTCNGSKTVTVDGNPIMLAGSCFSVSSGNEPGTAGGISSGVTKGKAQFINYSFDVLVEGKPVCRRLDPMVSNISGSGNTPPAPLMQPNVTSEEQYAGGHMLSFALQLEHPNTVSGRVRQPTINAGYFIRGPETHKKEKKEDYVGLQQLVGAAGPYSIQFSFDRKRKRLESDKQ
jgi:hypothetical protein